MEPLLIVRWNAARFMNHRVKPGRFYKQKLRALGQEAGDLLPVPVVHNPSDVE